MGRVQVLLQNRIMILVMLRSKEVKYIMGIVLYQVLRSNPAPICVPHACTTPRRSESLVEGARARATSLSCVSIAPRAERM